MEDSLMTPLDLSFNYGFREMQILLFSVGADINKCKRTKYYILEALKNKDYNMVKFLLYLSKSGLTGTENINVDGIHTYKSVPWRNLGTQESFDALKFLIDNGAKTDNILSSEIRSSIVRNYLQSL